MKKLIIATICLLIVTITSCSSNQTNSQNDAKDPFLQNPVTQEDSYLIPFNLDENQTGLSEEEVYDKIFLAYEDSRILNNIIIAGGDNYLNTKIKKYVIYLYDPFASSLYVENETRFPTLSKEKEDLWNKYVEQFIPQLEKIKTLINNNLSEDGMKTDADIRVYYHGGEWFHEAEDNALLLSVSSVIERRERDKNIDPAMGQVIEKVKEYYAETNLITDIYYDVEADMLEVDIYDPELENRIYEWDEVGPFVPESKQEEWNEYVNSCLERSKEISQMLDDCGFGTTDSVICVYLDNMYMTEEGRETTLAYIWGDSVVVS